jgi:hypothetical protein
VAVPTILAPSFFAASSVAIHFPTSPSPT